MICLYRTFNTHWGKEDGKHTWFLKERCRTGSSAAREMLLSKMKNRIRLVKMLSLTIRWQWTRNLQERGEAQLYLSENSQTWETLTPPLLPAGLAPEDCSSEQLPFAPAAGRRWAQAAVLDPGCWAALALHIMHWWCTRSDQLPAGLKLGAFEWQTVTPSWQSLLWFRCGLKPANPKLYPLLSFKEQFPFHLGGKLKWALGGPMSFWAGAGVPPRRSYGGSTLLTGHTPGQMDVEQAGIW